MQEQAHIEGRREEQKEERKRQEKTIGQYIRCQICFQC